MKDKVQIFLISAVGCKHCDTIKSYLEDIKLKSKRIIDIKSFNFDDKVAIKIALNNKIDDLPALIIGKSILKGEKISYSDIETAIKNN